MSQVRNNWITAQDMVRSRAWRYGYEDFRLGAPLDYSGHRSKALAYEYGRLTAAYLKSRGQQLFRISTTRPISEVFVPDLARALVRCLDVKPANWKDPGSEMARTPPDVPGKIVEPENVDPRVIVAARPFLMAVQNHVVAFGDHAFEMRDLAGIFGGHPFEVIYERLLAIGDMRIVLNVDIAHELLDRAPRLTSIEHPVVEGDGVGFVLVKVGRHVFCPLRVSG